MKRRQLIATIGRNVQVDLGPGQCGVVLVTVVDMQTGQLINDALSVFTMERDDSAGIHDGLALVGLTNALAIARAQKAN